MSEDRRAEIEARWTERTEQVVDTHEYNVTYEDVKYPTDYEVAKHGRADVAWLLARLREVEAERDEARAEHNTAVVERDMARAERDKAEDRAEAYWRTQVDAARAEIERLREERDRLAAENACAWAVIGKAEERQPDRYADPRSRTRAMLAAWRLAEAYVAWLRSRAADHTNGCDGRCARLREARDEAEAAFREARAALHEDGGGEVDVRTRAMLAAWRLAEAAPPSRQVRAFVEGYAVHVGCGGEVVGGRCHACGHTAPETGGAEPPDYSEAFVNAVEAYEEARAALHEDGGGE